MSTQPSLAGTDLPHPRKDDGWRAEEEYRGGQRIMSDGSSVVDLVDTTARHVFYFEWDRITASELGDIQTAFAAIKASSGSLTTPDGNSYTVEHDPGNRRLTYRSVNVAGTVKYNVSLSLREA